MDKRQKETFVPSRLVVRALVDAVGTKLKENKGQTFISSLGEEVSLDLSSEVYFVPQLTQP